MRITRRSLGQNPQGNPCACQYILPGVTPIPGLPTCDSKTGTSPSCSAAQGNAPFCAGIPYGQPGYADCIKNAAASTFVGAIGPPVLVNQAPYQAILNSLPAAPAPSPASSSSPPPAPSAGSGVTQGQITQASNASPVNVSGSPAPLATGSPLAFLTDTMFDGIPNWALFAAAGLGIFLFMEKH